MNNFQYKAVRIRQTDTGDWLVLFAAPAVDVEMWAGIPQKKELGDQETTGFQREENKKRIKEIASFYHNEKNIIQNPLLCAIQNKDLESVEFELKDDDFNSHTQLGILSIFSEDLEQLSLLELLNKVKEKLEYRVPLLGERTVPDQLVCNLKQQAEILPASGNFEDSSNGEDDLVETSEGLSEQENTELSFSDESHILDFWDEVTARVRVLEEISESFDGNEFLGYTKEAMIAFLRPIVIVDGQHRLRAAIASAKQSVGEEPYRSELEDAILNDGDCKEVQRNMEAKAARKLPISLLMNTDPAEHVFQFVVVNQKATPIGRALLGTIVSTSLSNEELERVSDRLENAGIKLEESRAVTFLSRHPKSPFRGLVERGLASDRKDRLQWNVLASIVKIFRDLKGGKLFHENVDYADKWKRDYLPSSGIITSWEDEGYESAFEKWHQLDGTWRDVFITFWSEVSDKLADKRNEEAWHYWGSPKQSNIFNKTSLTILASDFFQNLCDRRLGIDSIEDIPLRVSEWLEGVDSNYFNRDWNLHGVKKDVPGIRKRWSKEWVQYRKDPQRLPKSNLYRQPLS